MTSVYKLASEDSFFSFLFFGKKKKKNSKAASRGATCALIGATSGLDVASTAPKYRVFSCGEHCSLNSAQLATLPKATSPLCELALALAEPLSLFVGDTVNKGEQSSSSLPSGGGGGGGDPGGGGDGKRAGGGERAAGGEASGGEDGLQKPQVARQRISPCANRAETKQSSE